MLGIAGLVGAGRSELARLIYGADRPLAGAMTFNGKTYAPKSPSAAVKAGFGLVPEERRADGLVLNKSVAFNAQLSNLHNIVFSPSLPLLNFAKRRDGVEKIVRDLAIKTQSIDELPDLADRVLVMADGRIVKELHGDALSRNAIVAASYATIENNRTA